MKTNCYLSIETRGLVSQELRQNQLQILIKDVKILKDQFNLQKARSMNRCQDIKGSVLFANFNVYSVFHGFLILLISSVTSHVLSIYKMKNLRSLTYRFSFSSICCRTFIFLYLSKGKRKSFQYKQEEYMYI